MRTNRIASSTDRFPAASSSTPTERRSRRHLRDLCDEVLASFRAARGEELFSEQDRSEGHALLSRVTPRSRG